MKNFPYLIAIAMIIKDNKRLMPIGGKSIKDQINQEEGPGQTGKEIALDLLVRIFQKSDDGSLHRAIGNESLLLLEMNMDSMQEILPKIKSNWINTGDKNELLNSLKQHSNVIWRISYIRYEGLNIEKLNV